MAPLLTVTALVGATMILLKRFDPNTKLVGFETRRLLTAIHNYQIASDVATLILAGGVLTMTSTGCALWLASFLRKQRTERRPKAPRAGGSAGSPTD